MNFDITPIVVSLIGLISLIITGMLIPLIKSKISENQWKIILTYAISTVNAAEIIFNFYGAGAEKLKYAIDRLTEFCKRNGIQIDSNMIRIAIENAWKRLGLDEK